MRSFDILNNGDGNSSTKTQIKLTSASQRASSVNPVKQINSFNIKTKQNKKFLSNVSMRQASCSL